MSPPLRLRTEAPRLIRFLIVGGLSAFLLFGMYALLSRVIWPHGNHTLEQAIAIMGAAAFNFFAHRTITYRARGSHTLHAKRYILVFICANLAQSVLFWIGHEALHLYDFFVLVIVTGLIALGTYTAHRFYTFVV